uniref:VWFA domain-containing protein n=1 Tax=Solibacter usitatus (strain Ellin6076) TaxID=234267 RepID=Q021P4_SOLUE
MQLHRLILVSGLLILAGLATRARAQAPAPAPTTIKTETRLVLVDIVVTKKGQYVDDLEMKNFKVWEDNKEQQLKTFSFGADPNSPAGQKRYIVLFFDNSTMSMGEQAQARQAAAHFIESNAGPDRLIAVVNYTGAVQVAQNFTDDIDRLKQVVSGIKVSAIAPGAERASLGRGGPRLGGAGDFSSRSMLLALRGMAKNLSDVPGRKSLILLTSGFPLTNEGRSEANAAIDACNKSNVAIYPIDARGLNGQGGLDADPLGVRRGGRAALDLPAPFRPAGLALAASPVIRIANFLLAMEPEQVGGARTGSTGGATGGSPGGSTGGTRGTPGGSPGGNPAGTTGRPTGGVPPNSGGTTRGTNTNNSTGVNNNNNNNNNGRGGYNPNDPNNPYNRNNPYNNPARLNIPEFPGATNNQNVMYLLAEGTGGFVITNTNDLIGGMKKIGQEQNQYYIVGYTPPESPEGSCHTLRVKVDRGGTAVRSRAGYCNVKGNDVLAGSPIEKTLESRATGTTAGTIAAAMRAPFFYTGENTARVAVAIEIPSESIQFEKVKGKMHSTVNVLGIAYKQDGSVGARFSDAVKLEFENQKEVQAFKAAPMHYENQFDIASGTYNLKVVFDSGGQSFGKLDTPLMINAYDGAAFAVSGVAFSQKFGKVTESDAKLDSVLLEGRSPLVAGPNQFTPTGLSSFKASETVGLYFEVYDNAVNAETKLNVAAQLRILDAKTLAVLNDSGNVLIDNYVRPGNPVVAAALKLPLAELKPGAYRLELKALDSAGNFATRTADFEIKP